MKGDESMNMKVVSTEVHEIECGSARLMQVIETKFARGTDEPGDPVREVTQYWSVDGQLLAEKVRCLDSLSDTEHMYKLLLKRTELYRRQLDCAGSEVTLTCEAPLQLQREQPAVYEE